MKIKKAEKINKKRSKILTRDYVYDFDYPTIELTEQEQDYIWKVLKKRWKKLRTADCIYNGNRYLQIDTIVHYPKCVIFILKEYGKSKSIKL